MPVMSDGIRSGVNWMRVELQLEHLRQRLDQQRLGQAGHADDQAVAADEQRQQHQLDDVVLADDELVQLGEDLLAAVVHLVGERDVVGRFEILFHVGHDRSPAISLVRSSVRNLESRAS